MLNQRQIEIILEMWKKRGDYLTASFFAKQLNVSLRTVQGDMKNIRKIMEGQPSVNLVSVTSKGSCLEVLDEETFSIFINSLYQTYAHESLNYPSSRINQLLIYLLNQFRPISMMAIENHLYVSHSTLLNDLKKIEEVLHHFDLEIFKSNNRLIIDGSEINKRRCLAEKNSYLRHIKDENSVDYIDEKQISLIKDLLMNALLKYKYRIADTEIQNAILILNIMLSRLQRSFYIQPEDLIITDDLGCEQDLSQNLFEQFSKKFNIRITEEEVNYFALYLKGQNSDQNKAIITAEMDAFIFDAFVKIKQSFGIDFTDNINLRISMALHCTPLSIRIKYNMQLKTNLLDYIKLTFPLGYDIAIYFSLLLEEKYGYRLSDAELSLIAVHFYSSLLETNNHKGNRKVLVITSLKNSMTMLLRQTLLKWFGNNISLLDFLNPMEATESLLNDYDVFLTTEKSQFFDNGIAMLINTFPDNHDYINIKLMMDGFKNIEDIIDIFQEDLFFILDTPKKTDILRTLSLKASDKFGLDTLYGEVLKREEMGSTYFSKGIAMPHPMHSVSSDTFVAVCVTPKSIYWDEENNAVNVVVLVCIGRNNPQAFQLWDYFAKIFADTSFSDKVVEQLTYEQFINVLKAALKAGIKEFE